MNNLFYYDKHHYLLFQCIYSTSDPILRRVYDSLLHDYRIEIINFVRGKKAKISNLDFLQYTNAECVILYVKNNTAIFDYYVQIKGCGIPVKISGRYLHLI